MRVFRVAEHIVSGFGKRQERKKNSLGGVGVEGWALMLLNFKI